MRARCRYRIDSTFYEPNAILAKPHPSIVPTPPESYGLQRSDQSVEVRQVRNVVMPWSELKLTKHPLAATVPRYRYIFLTPKYRHGAHTTPTDIDWMECMLTDLLFLRRFYADPDPWANLRAIHDSVLKDFAPARRLGFRLVTSPARGQATRSRRAAARRG